MQRREKGTGTIFQRDSGTWSGRVSIGRGGNGKIKYKYFSRKTEAEVKRKIREYNKSGRPQNPQQILLKDYLMSWLTNPEAEIHPLVCHAKTENWQATLENAR